MASAIKFAVASDEVPVGAIKVSYADSAEIAAKNPGPGRPISALPISDQHRLREGELEVVELRDLLEATEAQ